MVLALLGQLGLVYHLSSTEPPRITTPVPVYEGFLPETATRIDITGRDLGAPHQSPRTITLVHAERTWGIAGTDQFPVDAAKVQELLGAVKRLRHVQPVTADPAFHARLEVDGDDYGRRVQIQHAGPPIDFYLGQIPSPNKIHLRRHEELEVYLVDGLSTWNLGVDAGFWVNRAYVALPTDSIWGVRIDNAKGRVVLERGPEGEWSVLGLPPGKASSSIDIAALVRRVSSLELFEPLGKTAKPGYGLDTPSAVVTITVGTPTVAGEMPSAIERVRIELGEETTDGLVFAKASSSEWYVSVRGTAVTELRDATAATFAAESK